MNKGKQSHYGNCFERNWNNIKNTWKEIKSIISLKSEAPSVLTVLSLDNGDTTTNPFHIANIFNFLASIAETTKKSTKYLLNIFQTIFQMKVEVQYFCNVLIKKKQPISYPPSL